MEIVHTPVLSEELIRYLGPRNDEELMIDATQGEGGHSYDFLSRFPGLRIIGIDADPEIQKTARERLKEFGDRVQFFSGWSQDFFSAYPASLERPDIILMDLGISLFHYERSGRGFSFSRDERLDMRIRTESGPSAADLVNRLPENELADLLYANAEERFARRIAGEIVRVRKQGPITSSAALAEIVRRAVPASGRAVVHPATKTFLALRIAVNGELSRLDGLLESAFQVLKVGGRMGTVSFHSLEHRICKDFFREKSKSCTCAPDEPICKCRGQRASLLVKKGLSPTEDEIRMNPPSRSARFRGVEKVL
jgi:16S rRNA (cytosine1402-N4)-methyltransferase